MAKLENFVVFKIDNLQFAIQLSAIIKVIWVIKIYPLTNIPDFIVGAINFYGELIPVVDLRNLFCIKPKNIELTDHLIITKTSNGQNLALWVDSPVDIIAFEETDLHETNDFFINKEFIKGILKYKNRTIIIQDLNRLLKKDIIDQLKKSIGRLKKIEST